MIIATKYGEKASRSNIIWIVGNLPLNLRWNTFPEIKRRITEAAAKIVEINYTFLFPRVGIAVHLKTEEDIKNLEQIINAIYPSPAQYLRLLENIGKSL